MQLEVGKRYVTRGGAITSPLVGTKSSIYGFQCNGMKMNWTLDGKFMSGRESHIDLVSEYVEPVVKQEEPATEPAKPVKVEVCHIGGDVDQYSLGSVDEFNEAVSKWQASGGNYLVADGTVINMATVQSVCLTRLKGVMLCDAIDCWR